jgi:hypothetical protein
LFSLVGLDELYIHFAANFIILLGAAAVFFSSNPNSDIRQQYAHTVYCFAMLSERWQIRTFYAVANTTCTAFDSLKKEGYKRAQLMVSRQQFSF